MTDTWDDSDDEWDIDDDALDAKLGLTKIEDDAEEDLAIAEREAAMKANQAELKKKGTALAQKKREEQERAEELELARKAMEMEAEAEANMSPDELRLFKQRQIEEADNALTDDLFGAVEKNVGAKTQAATEKVIMKDIKDHLKHARKIGECIRGHGKIHLAGAFLKEVIQQCKDVLDDDAITDIIKSCNVIKNEKVQAAKRKVKGQAQKAKKVDKVAEAKVRQKAIDTFGENDEYDDIDQIGADYEDAFF